MPESANPQTTRSFAWIAWLIVILILLWQAYLGVTIKELGIPNVFTIKFGERPPPPARMSQLEDNIDRYGSDYKDFVAGSVGACLEECARDQRCKAVSFNKSSNQCWMKTAAALRKDNSGFVSAVKVGD